jgi:hypothetical protein
MPPAPVTPDQLRQRAGLLRRLASRLDMSLAIDLHRRAAEDTWLGPTPRRCHEELLATRTAILAAGRDLQIRAAGLEQRAGQLDVSGAG